MDHIIDAVFEAMVGENELITDQKWVGETVVH